MLAGLFAIIPILGPFIDAGVAIVKGHQDTKVKLAQTEAGVTTSAMQAANAVTIAAVSDASVRACRDMIMFPGSIYCGTIIWDRFMDIRHPEWVWGVKPLEGAMEYLPHVLLAYFFGAAAIYYIKRK